MTSAGYERPTKGNSKNKLISRQCVFTLWCFTPKTKIQLNWLFLPKHKLELMFSSIEPYAPRTRYLPGNLFPALGTTNTYSYHPLFLPANEKIACTRSQTASQSALRSLLLFTLEIPLDLYLQFSQAAGLKRLFPHPPSTFLSYLYRCL